jgi:hypothetical protein
LALAVAALIGPWAMTCATPGDEPAVRSAARIDPPFVPAIDAKPVPGFKIKMRGERIAYCRIEQKIGTRFKSETCIDPDLMPAYLAALEENREAARQIRTGENRIY